MSRSYSTKILAASAIVALFGSRAMRHMTSKAPRSTRRPLLPRIQSAEGTYFSLWSIQVRVRSPFGSRGSTWRYLNWNILLMSEFLWLRERGM